mgnify:FL=1|tara:strand:- start:82 stop:552 length:471 start_codon:yes stop_codon:yes gene_type:complete
MSKKRNIEIVIVLDNIRSMHNIGSIFRTSDAFDVNSIFLCGICAKPPNKEIHKTALGSTQTVKWQYFSSTKNAIEQLVHEGYHIIAIEQTKNSSSLNNTTIKKNKIALVLGNEVTGVSSEILSKANQCIEIQQYGTKTSMNVSVVAGIMLWFVKNK